MDAHRRHHLVAAVTGLLERLHRILRALAGLPCACEFCPQDNQQDLR